MANKKLKLTNNTKKILLCILIASIITLNNQCFSKELTDLTHINLSPRIVKDIKQVEKLIEEKEPKAIYIEQWILAEKGNEHLLRKLHKIANKHDTKLYLFVGKDSWIGRKGVINVIAALDEYGGDIDGIVLKHQPNKTNIWKNSVDFQVQILNHMLDAYSAIHMETKKRNKQFIIDFPYWYTDYKGPKRHFSENACEFADKIILLIDNIDMLEKLDVKWNDVTCVYNIDLTKHVTLLTDDDVNDIYKLIKSKFTFYSNFNGFIIDSDSDLKFIESENKSKPEESLEIKSP